MEENKKSGRVFSITALIIGIISILFFFVPLFRFVLPICAIIMGIIGITRKNGMGMAISGLVCGCISLIIAILITGIILNPGSSSNQTQDTNETNKCQIRFLADGNEVKSYYVNRGDKIEAPSAPEKEGYEFSHWATHEKSVDGSEIFNFDTPIQTHTTLFAHYKSKPIQVKPSKKTKENYDKIQNGMTREEVVEVLGEPDSISENEIEGYGKTEMYNYNVSTTSGCQIYFHDGIVNMKNWTSI